jgi:signal transduction histidine kinase
VTDNYAHAAVDYFLMRIAHELRTPLSGMLLWSKLLSTAKETPDLEEWRDGLESITGASQEMHGMIDRILHAARLVAGSVALEMGPVEGVKLVTDAVASASAAAREREVRVSVKLDRGLKPIQADARSLRVVVDHLLENAIDFTPSGGAVTVEMTLRSRWLELCVVDNGRGFDREELTNVFDPALRQQPQVSGRPGKLGLGLFVSQRLVELHGGTIQVESAGRDRGARFIVCFPVKAAPRAGAR